MRGKSILMVVIIMLMIGLSSLMVCISGFGETPKKGEPIVIGAPIPRASPHGQNGERNMVLAVEQINAAGGIRFGDTMRPIKLEIVDTRDHEPGLPTTDVLLAIEKLILEKKPHILLGGPNMSEAALAAMDLIAKYKVLHIHSIGAWTPVWHMKAAKDIEKYKYSFKVATHMGYLVKDLAGLLHHIKTEFKFDKIFITVADAEVSRAFAKIGEELAVKDGWEVVGKEIHPLATTDYSMLLRNVRRSGAQVIFIFDHTPESLQLVKQWFDLKIPALLVGGINMTDDPEMWKATKGKVANIINLTGEAGNLPGQEITPLTKPYFEAYKKRYGMESRATVSTPSFFGAYMIKEVVERTQSIDPDKLIPAIENIDMITISGRLRFDKTNHQALYGDNPKETLLNQYFQWQDGKRVCIWPKSIAVGNIQLPPGMKK